MLGKYVPWEKPYVGVHVNVCKVSKYVRQVGMYTKASLISGYTFNLMCVNAKYRWVCPYPRGTVNVCKC